MPKIRKLYGKSRTIPILKRTIDLCSWVIRGKTRKIILFQLEERKTPAEIVAALAGKESKKSGSLYAQTSRGLAELEGAGLVKCLNPKEKTGRFYELTKRGRQILKELIYPKDDSHLN